MSFYFFVSANLINRYKNKFFFFLLADEASCYQKKIWNRRQHQDKILNSTPAPKKSPPCHLTCSGPLPSLSICTAPGPLLSLSFFIGDCSSEHPMSRLRPHHVPPGRPLWRPPCTTAPTTTPRRALRRLRYTYHPVPERPLRWQGGTTMGGAQEDPHPPRSPPRSSSKPPISRAYRPGLLPHLRAHRRAHH
jgi:hypothetical protein